MKYLNKSPSNKATNDEMRIIVGTQTQWDEVSREIWNKPRTL